MARSIAKLSDFDPQPIIEYAITEKDLTNVYQYLRAMQAHLEEGTWDEICMGGYYGTSALLHEIVELRLLLSRDPYLLTRSVVEIKTFARSARNHDAHINGLEVEYAYLQRTVHEVFGVHSNIGALLKANSLRPEDWDDLFETNLPFFDPSREEVVEAKKLLADLRKL
jgi:hypothetical protein